MEIKWPHFCGKAGMGLFLSRLRIFFINFDHPFLPEEQFSFLGCARMAPKPRGIAWNNPHQSESIVSHVEPAGLRPG